MNRRDRRDVARVSIEDSGTKRPKLMRKWDRRYKNRLARIARRQNRGR
jgi:hypothetical protein